MIDKCWNPLYMGLKMTASVGNSTAVLITERLMTLILKKNSKHQFLAALACLVKVCSLVQLHNCFLGGEDGAGRNCLLVLGEAQVTNQKSK